MLEAKRRESAWACLGIVAMASPQSFKPETVIDLEGLMNPGIARQDLVGIVGCDLGMCLGPKDRGTHLEHGRIVMSEVP
jgi:hypothetical protein